MTHEAAVPVSLCSLQRELNIHPKSGTCTQPLCNGPYVTQLACVYMYVGPVTFYFNRKCSGENSGKLLKAANRLGRGAFFNLDFLMKHLYADCRRTSFGSRYWCFMLNAG